MSSRITVLPDDRLAALHGVIVLRLQQAAESVCQSGFGEFFDGAMREVFCACLAQCGAHEGSVWLLDENQSALVPRFNNGPNAANFVGQFRQPLSSGLISAVVATEQPMCENDMQGNTRRDPAAETKLGVRNLAMLAVPFYFVGEVRGVLSAVQVETQPPAPGFSPEDLVTLQTTATILGRLIERRLLGDVLGLEEFA